MTVRPTPPGRPRLVAIVRAHRGSTADRRVLARAVGAGLAVAVVAACSDDSPSTLPGRSAEGRRLADTWWQLLGLGTAVFLVVGGLILWALLRRSAGRGGEPRGGGSGSGRGEGALPERRVILIGGIAVPAAILAVVAGITIAAANDLDRDPDEAPLEVEVVGHKWWWEVRYPDAGIVTANELRLPAGRPIELTVSSEDVIHSFWVPELGGKIDLVPGVTNSMRFTPDEPGRYLGLCAEFCGIQHANMRFVVITEAPERYDEWVDAHRQPPAAATDPDDDLVARGRDLVTTEACAGCHTIQGTDAAGTLGPDLTLFGDRSTLGAGLLPVTDEHLAQWIQDAPSLKPGVLMPPIELSPDEVEAIVAYLRELR